MLYALPYLLTVHLGICGSFKINHCLHESDQGSIIIGSFTSYCFLLVKSKVTIVSKAKGSVTWSSRPPSSRLPQQMAEHTQWDGIVSHVTQGLGRGHMTEAGIGKPVSVASSLCQFYLYFICTAKKR